MKASGKQVAGSHYKDFSIQPAEFIHKNGIGFLEGNVIKYVCRHNKKNGRKDLEKAIHYLELLLEWQYGEEVPVSPAGRPVPALPEHHTHSWPYHPGVKVDPYEGE